MRKKDRFQLRRLFVFFLSITILILSTPVKVQAATGDFSIDFAAAAPYSYDHLLGGGAYDDGTIGTHADVVESLEGGDFRCGDIVTYLTRIRVSDTDSADQDAPQTIRLDFEFLADTTGQSGVAIIDIVSVKINYGTITDLIPDEDSIDNGIHDDGGSEATLVDEHFVGTPFTTGAVLRGSVEVDDLERNETVILRIDVKLGCKPGSNPTGNLQAELQSAWLVATGAGAVEPEEAIPSGAQTVPFKQVGDIGAADINLEKTVRVAGTVDNFTESVSVLDGTEVEYRYVVTSLATTSPPGAPLYDVTVIDDNGTPSNTADDFYVPLTGLSDIDDDGQADDLDIGATATGTVIRTIASTSDSVINIATASGKDSLYMPETLTDTDTATVYLKHPALTLEKTGIFDAGANGLADPGELITYTFVVRNIGNVTLTNVVVTDPMLGPITLTGTTIPVGGQVTGSQTYAVTQADIDAGLVYNLATADSDESLPDEDDETVVLPQEARIGIVKSGSWIDGDGDAHADVGEVIHYTFTVTNEGNVTLTNVRVTDPKVTVIGGPTTLDVGETDSTTFSGTYTITQADIDAGQVDNTATADSDESGPDTDNETVLLPQNAKLSLVKSGTWIDGDGDGQADVGEVIHYTFAVTNEGNVTLTNVRVTDPKVTVMGGPTTLAVGETDSTTFSGTYTITQADIDAGFVYNLATADSDESEADEDEHTQPLAQHPAIELEKTGAYVDENADGIYTVGDKILYTFTVSNTGNVTLTNIRITDPLIILSGGPITSLDPGATDATTFTGIRWLTQDDIDQGTFTNIATVHGTPPMGTDVTDTDDDTQQFVRNPALTLEKTGAFDAGANGLADLGELVTYTFVVTNTGNVTLTNVVVTDPLLGTITLTDTTIPVGGQVTGSKTYPVTQADIDAGFVYNLATADSDESEADTDDHIQPLNQDPALELTKTGVFDAGADGFADPGELITYTFVVRNTGNVTLTNVVVTDPLLGTITLTGTTIPVGGQVTGSKTYPVTQADIDAGFVYNLATADSDESEADTDDHHQPLPQNPMLELVKTGVWLDEDADGWADAGETVHYTFAVTNVGNETLHDITIQDTKVPVITYQSGDDGDGALQVGETWVYTGSYQLTQADVDAGVVDNLAIADSSESDSDASDETTGLPQNPSLQIDKSTNGEDGLDIPAGSEIVWRYVVTNIGNVTLSDITVLDDQGVVPVYVSGDSDQDHLLDLEETWTYEAIGQAQAGDYLNTGTVTGQSPLGDPASAQDDSHYFGYVLDIDLEKDVANLTQEGLFADLAEMVEDETARYRLTITNDSNVSLDNIIVTDTQAIPGTTVLVAGDGQLTWMEGTAGLAQLNLGTLAAGAQWVLTYDYRTLHSDIGQPIINTATVTGVAGDELAIEERPVVTDEDDATISVEAIPLAVSSLSIEKLVRNQTANGVFDDMATGLAGDVFCYFVEITNDGATVLSNITLTDDRAAIGSQVMQSGETTPLAWADDGTGKATIIIGTLAPGESVSFTYRYTAALEDEGEVIVNTAIVEGAYIPTVPGYETILLEQSDDAAIILHETPPQTGEAHATGQTGLGLLLLVLAGLIVMLRRKDQLPS